MRKLCYSIIGLMHFKVKICLWSIYSDALHYSLYFLFLSFGQDVFILNTIHYNILKNELTSCCLLSKTDESHQKKFIYRFFFFFFYVTYNKIINTAHIYIAPLKKPKVAFQRKGDNKDLKMHIYHYFAETSISFDQTNAAFFPPQTPPHKGRRMPY